ncbi:MAG: Abi family protein [Coriobacteriia bacterium]
MAVEKTFHTFDELVGLLESRGVAVDDSTRIVLKRESYYAVVNGYKDLFLDAVATNAAGEDRYRSGTSFTEIHALFLFDRNVRMTLLPALLIAETTVKTLTVHTFCSRYPARNAYLDASNYRTDPAGAYAASRVIAALEKSLEAQGARHPKDFIQHYHSKHQHVPLWVLANFLTFGAMSKFYSALNDATQAAVCRELHAYRCEVRDGVGDRVEPRQLRLMFRYLSDLRNLCAHEERLYCTGFGKSKDIRLRQLLGYLEILLTPAESRRMREGMLGAVVAARAGIRTVSLDAIVACMGFHDFEDAEAYLREAR